MIISACQSASLNLVEIAIFIFVFLNPCPGRFNFSLDIFILGIIVAGNVDDRRRISIFLAVLVESSVFTERGQSTKSVSRSSGKESVASALLQRRRRVTLIRIILHLDDSKQMTRSLIILLDFRFHGADLILCVILDQDWGLGFGGVGTLARGRSDGGRL